MGPKITLIFIMRGGVGLMNKLITQNFIPKSEIYQEKGETAHHKYYKRDGAENILILWGGGWQMNKLMGA